MQSLTALHYLVDRSTTKHVPAARAVVLVNVVLHVTESQYRQQTLDKGLQGESKGNFHHMGKAKPRLLVFLLDWLLVTVFHNC